LAHNKEKKKGKKTLRGESDGGDARKKEQNTTTDKKGEGLNLVLHKYCRKPLQL